MHLNQDALRFRSGYGIRGWTKIWTCTKVGVRFPLDSARGSHPARIRGWTKINLFRWSGISASLDNRRDPAQDYWIGIWLLKFDREYSPTNRQKQLNLSCWI